MKKLIIAFTIAFVLPPVLKAGIIRHKQDLFNPKKNIRAGKYILTKYYGQTGCLEKTLKKYSGNKKRYFREGDDRIPEADGQRFSIIKGSSYT